MIFARDNASRVRFRGSGDQILLAARSDEKGEGKEEVPMISNNGDVEIAFNGYRALPRPGCSQRDRKGPGVRIENDGKLPLRHLPPRRRR